MNAESTRRSFIRKTGAALSVPLAAAGAVVRVRAAEDDDPIAARLARLEDMNAIRAVNQTFARQVSAGQAETLGIDPSIRQVTADDFGERDVIDVASDRQSATGVMHCSVEIETAIGPSCPLVEMARAQGGGVVRRSESGVFENTYRRRDGIWSLERSTLKLIPER
jgi:hypothetical protein